MAPENKPPASERYRRKMYKPGEQSSEKQPPEAEQQPEKISLKAGVIDISSAIAERAEEVAEAKMTESRENLKGIRGFFKKMWRHGIARDYYKTTYRTEAAKEIRKTGNIYTAEADEAAHEKATKAIVDRFLGDYEELVHKEAGEGKRVLGVNENEAHERAENTIKAELQDAIKEYAAGAMDKNTFLIRKNQLIARAAGFNKDVIQKGELFADNLIEIAEQVKKMVDHGRSLENLDLDLDITIGRAKLGARTEVEFNTVDRLVDRLTSSSVGKFIGNETAVAGVVAGVYTGLALAGRRVVMSKAAAVASYGATALGLGAIAGYRERVKLERERQLHLRQRAVGLEFDPDLDKRRAEMDEFRYETKDARDISAEIKQLIEVDQDGHPKLKSVDNATFTQLSELIGDLEARIQLSDTEKMDLISYSSLTDLEDERLQLDILRAQAKVAMREADRGSDTVDIDDLLKWVKERRTNELFGTDSEIKQKQKAFRWFKNKQSAKKALMAVATGLAIGSTAQELAAAISEEQFGLIDALREQLPSGWGTGEAAIPGDKLTGLEALRRWFTGEWPAIDTSSFVPTTIGSNTFDLPADVQLLPNSSGGYDMVWGAGQTPLAEGLTLNPDGTLTTDALDKLQEAGIDPTESYHTVATTTLVPGTQSVDDFLDMNGAVERVDDVYYHNDTVGYIDPSTGEYVGSDFNELGLDWGGQIAGGEATGIDAHGNYVFNVADLTSGGSWSGAQSVDAPGEMAAGRLKILLSASENTNGQVFELDVDPVTGDCVIPQNSAVGKALFENVGGEAVFKGHFAQIAEMKGIDASGDHHYGILATHQGEGVDSVKGLVEQTEFEKVVETSFEFPEGNIIDLPPILPISYRTPLEKMSRHEILNYFYYRGNMNKEQLEALRKRMSPELRDNPKAKLDHYKENGRYIETWSKDYKKDVKALADQLGPMGEKIRLACLLPVAGHQEGKNIYQSLKNYTYQTAARDSFEIVLFVNHPDKDKAGNPVVPDETLSEIERFQNDFPDMPVKVMYSKIDLKDARIGHIRKLLSDATIYRQHERGEDAADLIMVSNDADNKGLSPKYVEGMLQGFEKHPEMEGIFGRLDWDLEGYMKHPAVHVGTRLMQFIELAASRDYNWRPSSGANFAYRSSIYSAVGGYEDVHKLGEDVAFGRALIAARDSYDVIGRGGGDTVLYTSARRAIDASRKGLAAVEQWSQGFSAFDDDIRRLELAKGEDIDWDDPEQVDRIREELERIVNRTIDAYNDIFERIGDGALPKDHRTYKRAMGFLGIKYEVIDERIEFTDISKLIDGFKKFQKEALLMRDAKSGKPGAQEALDQLRREAMEMPESQREYAELTPEVQDYIASNALDFGEISDQDIREQVKTASDRRWFGRYAAAPSSLINEGSTGRIYNGYNRNSRENIVVKEMPLSKLEYVAGRKPDPDKLGLELYLKEKNFRHPFVKLPQEHFLAGENLYKVYDRADVSLEEWLEKSAGNKVDAKTAVNIMIRVASGLGALHEAGVTHLDVHPGNIVIQNNELQMIDLDAGAIDVRGDGTFVREGAIRSVFMSAPELFRHNPVFKANADVYGAGGMLYRLMAGKYPYEDESISAKSWDERRKEYLDLHNSHTIDFPAEVPASLRRIISKALEPNPNQRYQSMQEMLADLLAAAPAL